MASSSIEWTENTWNFVTGCSKVSTGCKNCYAEVFSKRLMAMGQPKYSSGFELSIHESILELPLSWKKPKKIFVNSMSDLFHPAVPFEIISKAFDVMHKASWHQFQILTKRSERLLELNWRFDWPQNVWMGVSVENSDFLYRVDHLRQISSKIKFLSLEPLLEPLENLNLECIDWVIVGGESGNKARPIKQEWVDDIRMNCSRSGVPFFFKQWGGRNKKKNGRTLNGKEWNGFPVPKLRKQQRA
ncbi:MAG: DUF5131 family protein [bacterium]